MFSVLMPRANCVGILVGGVRGEFYLKQPLNRVNRVEIEVFGVALSIYAHRVQAFQRLYVPLPPRSDIFFSFSGVDINSNIT